MATSFTGAQADAVVAQLNGDRSPLELTVLNIRWHS
jgi:hypothetical protein